MKIRSKWLNRYPKKWSTYASLSLVVVILIVGAIVVSRHKDRLDNIPYASAGSLVNADGSTPNYEPSSIVPSGNGPHPCASNLDDVCVTSPSVDFYPSGTENIASTYYRAPAGSVLKDIGGVVSEVDGRQVKLSTASGRTFIIIFPINAVEWWNSVRSPNYGNYKVGIGDTMMVSYGEPANLKSIQISPEQIYTSRFAIKDNFKKK